MSITFSIRPHKYFYRPQTKLREGYVFTRVCDSVHRGVCVYHPQADTPGQTPLPPWADTPRPVHAGIHPLPAQCMPEYGKQAGGTHPTGMHSCIL